jgi:CheY-like chemotaxis protein
MTCETILLVEDDDDIRSTLKEVLELEGYNVATAAHGQEAFTRLEEIERPCVILLDLMMPVMNGWEFLEKQKESARFASIPVLVVSAAGDKARSASAQGFVKKPIEVDGLLEMIKKYCSKPSM